MDRTPTNNSTALVVGGSLGGLLAARVLSEHCREVTVVERDLLPAQPGPRRGVPQARHQHALLKRGRLIIERLFPGMWDELIAAGAPVVDMADDFEWLTPSGWAVRFASEFLMLTCSRDLLEWSIRRRLLSNPRVRFVGYASRIYKRRPDQARDCSGVYVQPAPPTFTRGGVILPLEGDRWHITLAGGSGDYPPTDERQFIDFARSLRSPRLYEIIEQAEPLSPVSGFGATENRWRHYERMERWPDGLVILGDAACAFNPVYAQGMTTAALAAETLGRCLSRRRHAGPSGIGREFQRALAKVCAPPWMLATGEDYRYEGAEGGSSSAFTRLMHRYVDRVVRLTTERADVRRVLLEVFHMLRPPSALFQPWIVARALGLAVRKTPDESTASAPLPRAAASAWRSAPRGAR
jgi:2-polyprenyl-6-methoxyphenol hydroxylase-like FAD-dependent oxidoreductase